MRFSSNIAFAMARSRSLLEPGLICKKPVESLAICVRRLSTVTTFEPARAAMCISLPMMGFCFVMSIPRTRMNSAFFISSIDPSMPAIPAP